MPRSRRDPGTRTAPAASAARHRRSATRRRRRRRRSRTPRRNARPARARARRAAAAPARGGPGRAGPRAPSRARTSALLTDASVASIISATSAAEARGRRAARARRAGAAADAGARRRTPARRPRASRSGRGHRRRGRRSPPAARPGRARARTARPHSSAAAMSAARPRRGRQPPSLVAQRVQAAVGGDPVEPGAHRRAPLELVKPAPGRQQRLLKEVLGVLQRAEDPVAVQLELAAIRVGQLPERLLAAGAGAGEGALAHGRRPHSRALAGRIVIKRKDTVGREKSSPGFRRRPCRIRRRQTRTGSRCSMHTPPTDHVRRRLATAATIGFDRGPGHGGAG